MVKRAGFFHQPSTITYHAPATLPCVSEPLKTEVSPWQSVWLRPAQTMRQLLVTREGDYWATPLLVAGGLLAALSPQMREELLSMAAKLKVEGVAEHIQGVQITLGIISGVLQAALWPLLLHGCASLLGGKASPNSETAAARPSFGERLRPTRLAAGWSSLPVLFGTLLAPLGQGETGALLGLLNMSLSVWSLVLLSHMLGEGYGIGPAKGALSVLLSGIVGFAFFFALTLVSLVLGR